MTKAFRTPMHIRGKEPLLRVMVCEVRYHDGYLYFDHSGRLVLKLMKSSPEWVVTAAPTPQVTSLYSLRSGAQLAFGASSASLSLDKSGGDEIIDEDETAEFVASIAATLGVVLDELEVTQFARVGFRVHYYFSFESKEDSERWLQALGVAALPPGFIQAFGASLESLGLAVVMVGQECRYRVALKGIERAAQIPVGEAMLAVRPSAAPREQRKLLLEKLKKERQRQVNAAYAVQLDIDAYLEDPQDPDVAAFVQQQLAENIKQFAAAVPKSSSKGGK